MKMFKDLEIEVSQKVRADFLQRIEERLPEGWTRDRDAEKRAHGPTTEGFCYYVCNQQQDRPPALVALVPRNENLMYVSNIVPRLVSELSRDQYNRILDEFATQCIKPIAVEMGISLKTTKEDETLEDWVSKGSAEKFRTFSVLANKSTGTSHPCDKERWYEFIISIVNNNDSLDSTTLREWMVAEDGWTEDVALEVVIEFEQEVGLLKYYRDK